MTRPERTTEARLDDAEPIDELPLAAAFDRMQREDARVAEAVAGARPEILRAIELVVERLSAGGRLLYAGAGTSGRLGVLDAAECPPTFGAPPELVQGVIAGGDAALRAAAEGAEDSAEEARRALGERALGERDVVLAISAGGTTPFAHAAVAFARERGAATVFLACVPAEQAPDEADLSIRVVVGPEVIAGSTRLKAGTATKLVLNRISTLAMVRLGRVHDGRMVALDARANHKLAERAVAMVAEWAGVGSDRARALLERAEGSVPVATLVGRFDEDPREARARLERAGGSLRRALEGPRSGLR